MRILVAGVGNVLKGDDAFGVIVSRRLMEVALPEGVRVVETGIAGVALVQELQEGWDALVVADLVDRDREPGTIMMIEPEVVDVTALSWDQRYDMLADMHMATPERALMLARALGVLPPRLLLVGCQPVDPDGFGMEMSPPVEAAVDVAVREIVAEVTRLAALEPTG